MADRVGRVVDPDHLAPGSEEAGRLEPLAAADVEDAPLSDAVEHGPVARLVQGEQRVRGHPLLRSLARQAALGAGGHGRLPSRDTPGWRCLLTLPGDLPALSMTTSSTVTAPRGRHAARGRHGSRARTGGRPGERGRWWWIGGAVVLAALAYVPLLAVRPGVVTPDTKTYLYLDPTRFLSQVAFMWNPTVGLGTVSHEYIGYLLPMGPFFAVFHLLGVPVWVAQRLWLGSILFAAGLGVLYLSRILGLRGPGPAAAALAYMLSPYFLQYAGRISVILLPWAGLPVMLGLTIVALRRGGWREPALFAVVVAVVSGINASSIIYVGVGPVLWLLYAVVVLRESTWRHALGTALRIGVLTLGACVWWMAGLEVEAAYGVNVLKFTETVPSTSATSNPADIVRGLGYWYFYGADHLGRWTNAAIRYTQDIALLATSYAVPVVALVAAAFVRWRERAYFLVLLFVGLVLSVGPFPFSNPTVIGRPAARRS